MRRKPMKMTMMPLAYSASLRKLFRMSPAIRSSSCEMGAPARGIAPLYLLLIVTFVNGGAGVSGAHRVQQRGDCNNAGDV